MSTAAPATPEKKEPQTPLEYLALFPNAPTPGQIDAYRAQVPGGRLRLLPMPDGKRLFLLRGFSGIELAGAQADAAKAPPERQQAKLESTILERCVLWNSMTVTGRLTESDLQSVGAGLSGTLYHAVADLSDFMAPQMIEQLFVDL